MLADFAQQNGLVYLALFSSQAREDASQDSDVDLLVEYPSGTSFFDVVRMERELSDQLQKKVDFESRKYLNKYVKPYVEKDLVSIHGKYIN